MGGLNCKELECSGRWMCEYEIKAGTLGIQFWNDEVLLKILHLFTLYCGLTVA